MRFEEVKGEVVLTLYGMVRKSDGQIYFQPTEINRKISLPVGIAFLHRACDSLAENGLLERNDYDGEPHFGLTDKGIDFAEERFPFDDDGAHSVPAANRLVTLHHNQPEYQQIADGLDVLAEELRASNSAGETSEERSRLLASIDAAKEFWAGFELKVIQIEIGIVMAITDAGRALSKAGKDIGWELLVDLARGLVKKATGIEI